MTIKKRPLVPGQEKFWEQNFKEAADSHWAWQISAVQLRIAFDIVTEEVDKIFQEFTRGQPPIPFAPTGVCMMLGGQLLEALLKGVLVSQKGAFNARGDFAHKTHDLLVLADKVSLSLSEQEAWLLERLTHYVEWAGKYPIALTFDARLPRALPEGGFGPPTYVRMGPMGDFRMIRQLATRVEGMLPSKIALPKRSKGRRKFS